MGFKITKIFHLMFLFGVFFFLKSQDEAPAVESLSVGAESDRVSPFYVDILQGSYFSFLFVFNCFVLTL